jgi:hypothetical protein
LARLVYHPRGHADADHLAMLAHGACREEGVKAGAAARGEHGFAGLEGRYLHPV